MRTRVPALLALVALLAPAGIAAADGHYPSPDGAAAYFDSACTGQFDRRFVFDFVGLVEPRWGQAVEDAACEAYARTSAHFALVTVQDTGGEPLENYALHLFETWGLGDAERHDGLLLLYVRDYNVSGKASAVRVEVGYGLEGAVNGPRSMQAVRLMQEAKGTALDAGETEANATAFALASGSEFLLTTLTTNYADGRFPDPEPVGAPPLAFWIFIVMVLLILVMILGTTSGGPRRRNGWGYYPYSPSWNSPATRVWVGGPYGPGGGFGPRNGGGGFGGGRSGGGGGSGGL